MAYKWIPLTADFDRSLPIKKWRFDTSCPIEGNYDCVLSELPNIYVENGGVWDNPQPENGYAFSNRFNIGQKYFSNRYYGFTDGRWTATTTSNTTLVEGTTYEFECPVDLYWAGNYTPLWDTRIPNYMWFYVQASTFEITPTESAATYESGTAIITVNTDNDSSITWTASTSDSWLSLSTLTGAGDRSVTITYEENGTFQSRTGTVTFTSNGGDVLTFTIEQEQKPVLVYDHPIYRSGNLVKKMYRSGELIYLRLNAETSPQPVTEPMLIHNGSPVEGDTTTPATVMVAETDTYALFDVVVEDNTPWAIGNGFSKIAMGTGSTTGVQAMVLPTNPEFMTTTFGLMYKKDGDGDDSMYWTGFSSVFRFKLE